MKLPYAKGANYDSHERQHEPYCLPNTRVDILRQIMAWSDDPLQKTTFWLNGMAGTGKSTIARTIARQLAQQKRLGANFFFSRGRGDLGHAGELFGTIAIQLAAFSPKLKHSICEAISKHDNVSRQSMRDQWTKLIYKPILGLGASSPSPLILVLVIDALDECGNEQDIRTLLQLLTETRNLKNVQLRVLITSTPIRLLHPSFRDFLINPERCADQDFWINDAKAHLYVAEQCLHTMSRTLTRNMCRLKSPASLKERIKANVMDQNLPFHVQYACQYWGYHLQKGTPGALDASRVLAFFRHHFLHWLEALSLMGKMPEAIHTVKILVDIPTVSAILHVPNVLNTDPQPVALQQHRFVRIPPRRKALRSRL